ncbi:DUF1801 domain-containing protein [Olleya sp. UBA1516]|uniref:DUF1801 domain-containing protein n=1 Tax=Olleya sp. UBA1516 TaxID=1947013 RepID=UPI0025F964CB|nr:DUF1801 domain-containing protein [Olleya sp. UBA1516]|tara:strand:- start:26248 stop:26709 length:462 start_codon:yes stop_codon:yes gene_type:complete
MTSTAKTPEDYINQLPEDRKAPITKLHNLITQHMPKGLEAGMGYSMLAYYVPKSIYPAGYHCKPFPPLPFINVASQKNFIAIYHSGLYAKKELYDWFVAEYPKHCKYKLDMGKSCIRFKKMDDIPYDLIEELLGKMSVEEWITIYESALKLKK